MTTNAEYENTEVTQSVTEVPGGTDVRINYSRSMSLDFGRYNAQVSYAANFDVKEVDTALEKAKMYVNAKVVAEIKNQLDNEPTWAATVRKK